MRYFDSVRPIPNLLRAIKRRVIRARPKCNLAVRLIIKVPLTSNELYLRI